MLIIRLQRTGKKNQANFRLVLAEKEAPVQKRFLEVLGSYNPRKKDFQANEDRLKYWLGQKVQVSETVHNLLVSKNLLQGGKVKAFNIPKKPAEAAPAAPAEAAAGSVPAETASASAEAVADKPAVSEQPAEQKPAESAA